MLCRRHNTACHLGFFLFFFAKKRPVLHIPTLARVRTSPTPICLLDFSPASRGPSRMQLNPPDIKCALAPFAVARLASDKTEWVWLRSDQREGLGEVMACNAGRSGGLDESGSAE